MKMRFLATFIVAAMLCYGVNSAMAQSEVPLEKVTVTTKAKDGSAEKGYVVETTRNLGPWGDKKLLDTPYTVHIVTSDYIENIQARNPGELFNRIPGVNQNGGGSEHNIQHTINIRGFNNAAGNGARFNGVPTGNMNAGIFLEDVESLEIISGLSGFMYGLANVGGLINYNIKRPLYDYQNKIRVGTRGNSLFYGHADLGGPIVGGALAYRVNMLAEKGDGPVEPQNLTRELISMALDWNVTEDLLLQFSGSYGEIRLKGREGGFYVEDDQYQAFRDPNITRGPDGEASTSVGLSSLPAPPDPSQLRSPLDTFQNYKAHNLGFGLKYRINDQLKIRAAAAYNEWERVSIWNNTNFTTDPDIYKFDARAMATRLKNKGAYAYLDANFETGPLEHKLTVGANGYYQEMFSRAQYVHGGNNPFQFTGRFSNPSLAQNFDFDQFDLLSRMGPWQKKGSDALNYNLVVGDDISFNDQWKLMVGVNYSTIRSRGYNAATGRKTSEYNKSALTPTVAIMFKPIPNLTTYVSYIESLEAGTQVPVTATWASNAGQHLPPLKSEQYEVGVKAEIGSMFLTAALYQINKGLQYADRSRGMYVQDGDERHRGLELTWRGKITKDLTLMGGLNFMDTKVIKSGTAAYIGKTLPYVPEFAGKLYAEYDLPFLKGLTVTAGLNHFGKSYTNNINSLVVPAYTTADLGLRFSTDALGEKMIYRLNVSNITDKHYWYGGGNNHLHTGQPRSIALSAEIQF